MHRRQLLDLLRVHSPFDVTEGDALARLVEFVERESRCFDRGLTAGHVTGSAWIVSDCGTDTVLINHRKLGRWLQPGGHADGNPDVIAVAWREAREETGLTTLRLERGAVFDVDIHEIPATAREPAHLHYDVRFLFRAAREEAPSPSDESHAVAWVALCEVETINGEASVQRMVAKVAV
jgi:8-oxo-dGTP pyrophosphatase MutT (NUDIX family)